MENHNSLDAEIDKKLIHSLMNSEEKRQLLSFLYIIYDKLLYKINHAETEEEKKHGTELVILLEHYDDSFELEREFEITDHSLLEIMWEFHFFVKQELYPSLDDYLKSKIQKKIYPLLMFFKDDVGNVTSYYFDLEELAKILSTYFKDLTYNKVQNQAFELENVKCPKTSGIHQLVILNTFDDVKVLYYPEETYNVFDNLEHRVIFEPIFQAEYELHQVMDKIDSHLSEVKMMLIMLLPQYFQKWRKIERYLENSIGKEIPLFTYLMDNEDKIDDEIIEVISPPTSNIKYYSEYTTGLNRILKLNSDMKKLKEKAEMEYISTFSNKARTYFSNFVSQMNINGPRDYGRRINRIYNEYQATVLLFKSIEIDDIKIAYHQYSLQRLGVSNNDIGN